MFRRPRSRNDVNSGTIDSLSSGGTQSSGDDSLMNSRDNTFDSGVSLYRSNQFDVYFLGMIQDVNLGGTQRDPDVQLIDRVEEAQLEGKIQLFPRDEDLVKLAISKHGVKVMNHSKQEVLQRHPLYTVAQIVYYNDSFFKSNLTIKIGLVGRSVYDCYIFQCFNEDQAQTVCQSLKDVFDSVAHHTR